MNRKDFNRDYWVIYQSPFFGRFPISYDTLVSLLGVKFPLIMRKLEQNKLDKFVVRPFHGEVYTFYRH